MEKTLQEQAKIVEQRLWYHFAGPTGELNAPAGLPFMKEFLAEVDRLVALAKRSDESAALSLHGVSGSLLSDKDYWKIRCQLSEAIEAESPCDPDITSGQIKAYENYHKFISNYGNDRYNGSGLCGGFIPIPEARRDHRDETDI